MIAGRMQHLPQGSRMEPGMVLRKIVRRLDGVLFG
jgi:hypothetical protein